MTLIEARAVADAVLFRSHRSCHAPATSPHDRALRSEMRFQFGVLAPRGAGPAENWFAQTECLVQGRGPIAVDVHVRCLQLRCRSGDGAWDEGVGRELPIRAELGSLTSSRTVEFALPAGTDRGSGAIWHRLRVPGRVVVESRPVPGVRGVRLLRVRVENRERWHPGTADTREDVLRRSLAAAHSVLVVRGGQFVSALEPPEWAAGLASGCANVNTWPVLIGDRGARGVLLCSPVILPDHPVVLPRQEGRRAARPPRPVSAAPAPRAPSDVVPVHGLPAPPAGS
ncbi:hypothetical protein ACL03H_12965 [Saccharopolyspora sp. MS10]|uniref:hypothetical protein n=1 Tax=Saccharopolyspora sp. MS10 TaxID=3385973 RepID=UPI0039A0FA6B